MTFPRPASGVVLKTAVGGELPSLLALAVESAPWAAGMLAAVGARGRSLPQLPAPSAAATAETTRTAEGEMVATRMSSPHSPLGRAKSGPAPSIGSRGGPRLE